MAVFLWQPYDYLLILCIKEWSLHILKWLHATIFFIKNYWIYDMETLVIELIKPLTLTKEDFPPINFEEGTVLKVLMKTPTGYLVTADSRFNFTVSFDDENQVWQKL